MPNRSWLMSIWLRVCIASVGVLAATLPLEASAQSAQYRYSGAYSTRGPDGARFDGRISSSRGEPPLGQAGVGGSILVDASLSPPFTRALAVTGNDPLTSADGFMSLSYSVVFTAADEASLNLAISRAATGESFGSVVGVYSVQAVGGAVASIVAKSESGGFGIDAGRFSESVSRKCGEALAVVGPANASECGGQSFVFGLYMERRPGTSSFVGQISLRSAASVFGVTDIHQSRAFAFADPLITVDPLLRGDLVIGGGLVGNAVPEPGTALLMLGGLALLARGVRRPIAKVRRD